MGLARGAALVAATITLGIMTKVFHLYAHAIMPGLRGTDDRTFVGAFQAVDRSIINPLFMGTFFGALLVANTDSLGERIQRAFPAARVVKTLNTMNEGGAVIPSLTVDPLLVVALPAARRGLTRGPDAAWAVGGMDTCLAMVASPSPTGSNSSRSTPGRKE